MFNYTYYDVKALIRRLKSVDRQNAMLSRRLRYLERGKKEAPPTDSGVESDKIIKEVADQLNIALDKEK